jgi:aspartokinase-like uncharacterized kinase
MRGNKEWEHRFQCVKRMMSVMDSLTEDFVNDNEILETCATMLRNPIIFDNNVVEVKTKLPYHIENMNKETDDHLIGMSNIVLYIHKRGIHKKWKSVEDFKKTLKALNVLLPIEKALNNSKTFKHEWNFNYDNIESCIEWDKKLESVGITELICNITKEKIPVNLIKELWYEENKQYL